MVTVTINAANFTPATMTTLLGRADLRRYLYDTEPTFGTSGTNGTTYELRWNSAVQYADGTNADLYLHMHEPTHPQQTHTQLVGGGAWLGGAAAGHGVNLGATFQALKTTCVAWLNQHYENTGDDVFTVG
jgi:hypothetical protein